MRGPPPPGPLGGGSHLIYVLTIRHPLDRVLSHFGRHRHDGRLLGYSFESFVMGEYRTEAEVA